MAAVVDDESVAEARMGWHRKRTSRYRIGAGQRAQIADRPERQAPERLRAEPIGDLGGHQRSENARARAAPVVERERQEFELEASPVAAAPGCARHHANRF